jgi:phenylpropionate dioxygenase-like ring-hydroxylating dioxygenase large terminal subunit
MDGSASINDRAAPNAPLALLHAVQDGSGAPLEHASTLPPECYTSEPFYRLEVERIFRKQWLAVGHIAQLPRVGDYFTIDLLGEMLVVVRAPERIRVLSRVCLHRWAPLVQGAGNTRRFSCPFHKWAYDLDGRLVGAPLMDQVDFTTHGQCLPEYRTEIVSGFIYLNFSGDAPPLAPQLQELTASLAQLSPEDWLIGASLSYDCEANWKIVVETFMECYHHIAAHPETFEPTYPARLTYVEEGRRAWTLGHAPARPGITDAQITAGFPDLGPMSAAERREFRLYLVYPYHLFNVLPDRTFWMCVQPEGPTRTRFQTHIMVRREALERPDYEERMAADRKFLEIVNAEDVSVNIMQQRGAATRAAVPGRFSHLEKALWQLADYVRERMKD